MKSRCCPPTPDADAVRAAEQARRLVVRILIIRAKGRALPA